MIVGSQKQQDTTQITFKSQNSGKKGYSLCGIRYMENQSKKCYSQKIYFNYMLH